MLILVFGSLSFIISLEKQLVKRNYQFIIKNKYNAKPIFVKIERIQNKSFFGFQHYYFTLSFWHEGKKFYLLKKISSYLYYKYKEGNQIEAVLILDKWQNPQILLIPQIIEEIKLDKAKYKNLEEITNIFMGLGILFLFFYFILNRKYKNVFHEF